MIRPSIVALVLGLAASAALVPLAHAAPNRAPVHQPPLKQPNPAARVAQDHCVREANRRGFTVIDTSNFQQQRDGWKVNLRVRDSRGKTHNGSCFFETRSRDVDLYGFGWGWDDDGDDRFEFNCSSGGSKYAECPMPIKGRAELVKRRSDAPCVEGRSWGQRGDRVWVDKGCRARFTVVRTGGPGHRPGHDDGPGRNPPPPAGRPGTPNKVTSADQARRACSAEVQRHGYTVREVGAVSTSGNEYRMTLKVRGKNNSQRTVSCRVDRASGNAWIT
jgi:hypothetical protein